MARIGAGVGFAVVSVVLVLGTVTAFQLHSPFIQQLLVFVALAAVAAAAYWGSWKLWQRGE